MVAYVVVEELDTRGPRFNIVTLVANLKCREESFLSCLLALQNP